MNKQKIIASGVLVGIVVLVAIGYTYLSLIKNSFFLISLNGHPVVESLNIVLHGEVSDINNGTFTLTEEDKTLLVNIDERTSFSKSADLGEILSREAYKEGDLEEGESVRITAVMIQGKIWADAIISD